MQVIFWQGGKKFEPGEHKKPVPAAGQVLIEVGAASICSTDFHYDDFGCIPPIVPGHEVAGTVIELGDKVDSVDIGQRVTVDPVQHCGKCPMCTSGIPHLCATPRHLGDTDVPGGWAEYMTIDATNTYKVPDNVSLTEAALTEPTAVCLESFKRANFESGQTVLVLGDGVFGCIHAMIAKVKGAKNIIVAGHHDERLKRIVEATGAIACNTHNQDLEKILKDVIGPFGADLAIEATGATEVPNIGLMSLRPRGTLVIFSLVWHPEILNLGLLNMKELNVLGACRSLDCFSTCVEMMASGQLDVKSLVDIEVPLGEFDRAVKELRENRKSIFKAVLHPGQ